MGKHLVFTIEKVIELEGFVWLSQTKRRKGKEGRGV